MSELAHEYDLEDANDPYIKYELLNGVQYGEPRYELIGGAKFIMAAAPNLTHSTIMGRLFAIFRNYIDENDIKAEVYSDNTDVYFSKKEHYMPDVSVVCNAAIILNGKRILGAPDLIIEVLSDSTRDNDTGIKKDTYEKYGVKEYWIVDPKIRQIEVYHLIDGKFQSAGKYEISDDEDKNKIRVSIFDGMIIDIRKVFKFVFNFDNEI